MGMDNNALNAALEAVNSLRAREDREYEKRLSALRESDHEYRDAESNLSKIGARIAVTAMSGNDAAIKSLKERAELFSEKRKAVMKRAGVPESPERRCKKCSDTGYSNGALCDCVINEAKRISFENTFGDMARLNADFSNFSLEWYPEEVNEAGYSPRKVMSTTLKICRDFCDNFPEGKNLLFTGESGLGKTHLSFAVASELLFKGYTVIYGSAQNLLSRAVREEMDWNGSGDYVNKLLGCDLLIIDDLGTEIKTAPVNSTVYNIINTRLTKGLSTIVNTNMDLEELEKRYDPRIVSRFIGNYTCRRFLGNDIRQLKQFAPK